MSDYRTCGACYELVHKYASVCPHCHTQLVAEARPSPAANAWAVIIVLAAIWYFFDASPVAVITWIYEFFAILFKGFFGIFLK